jgi:two-component sensor histidine kinase
MNATSRITATDASETTAQASTSLSGWRIFLIALIAALAVFLIGTALDYVLLADVHDSRVTVVEVSDALGGLVAGALMFRLLQYERERRERLRQKLAVIADMNHHVRNALQVISFHAYSSADKEQLEAVRQSMERIQWALKEILPKL